MANRATCKCKSKSTRKLHSTRWTNKNCREIFSSSVSASFSISKLLLSKSLFFYSFRALLSPFVGPREKQQQDRPRILLELRKNTFRTDELQIDWHRCQSHLMQTKIIHRPDTLHPNDAAFVLQTKSVMWISSFRSSPSANLFSILFFINSFFLLSAVDCLQTLAAAKSFFHSTT